MSRSSTTQGAEVSRSSTTQATDRPKRQPRGKMKITGYIAAKRHKHDRISVTSISFACCETWCIYHAPALLSIPPHPAVYGLQSLCLFAASGCQFIGTSNGPFVQILDLAGNHWICVSNVGCLAGHVNVFDSTNTSWPNHQTAEAADCVAVVQLGRINNPGMAEH